MTAPFRCPDCGAVPVGRHADVCWRREEAVPVAQTETYRSAPGYVEWLRTDGKVVRANGTVDGELP